VLINYVLQILDGVVDVSRPPVWLHKDLMADNILMEEARLNTVNHEGSASISGSKKDPSFQPRYILDYGDIIHGEFQKNYKAFSLA
jgi:hypothetical protein